MSKRFEVLVEYGERRADGTRLEIGRIRLPEGVTEEQACEAALETMSLYSRLARTQGWPFGVVTGTEEVSE